MCVGLALMFRLMLFVLRFSTSSGRLVHSFSKWFQSINSFLHVVDFLGQFFDHITERNILLNTGTCGTSFIQHICSSKMRLLQSAGSDLFSLETLQRSCSYGCFS